MWVDSHCHVHDAPEEEADAAVAEAAAAGVGRLVAVGTDMRTSHLAVELADRHGGVVVATAGIHPHDAAGGTVGLRDLLDGGDVVAVGECGLDYHYDHSPRTVQRGVFAAQVDEARERRLALVVHTREAWDDTFAILESEGPPERTVLHCFTGGPGEAERALEAGLTLSFSGIVSFKGAAEVREAAALCPLDRLLVETDSPYLAPVPHRGKANRPAWVPLVGEAVAAAKGIGADAVEEASTANAHRVFRFSL